MSISSDVVIVGAGIVGAACAWVLAREGIRVTIVDAAMIGGGATAAGMGHVVVMDDSPAQLALTRYSQQLWHELVAELPADCEHDLCGTLWVAADEDELVAAGEKARTFRDHGIVAELLDARQLAETEPQLRPGLAGGLIVPGDLVIYPPCAARWLIEQAQEQGAELRLDCKVVSLGGDHALLADGTRLAAGAVINAAGTAAATLTPRIPIRPRKGHLAITDRYRGFVHHQLVELGYIKSASGGAAESVAFNVQPRRTGQLLIGSSRQYVESGQVETSILGKMLCRAIDYLPDLARLNVLRTWTGFRAATDDKLPLIGPWPLVGGMYLAAGHEGLGITTSLGTAELLADVIMGRASKIPREPYLPERVLKEHRHA
ncbi:MAG: NAD(P)/FAD-dependent oxidoreductase [Thermoguttaceae bacterium]